MKLILEYISTSIMSHFGLKSSCKEHIFVRKLNGKYIAKIEWFDIKTRNRIAWLIKSKYINWYWFQYKKSNWINTTYNRPYFKIEYIGKQGQREILFETKLQDDSVKILFNIKIQKMSQAEFEARKNTT